MDRWSVDPPFARFDVDIGFSDRETLAGGVGGDGGKEIRDENGEAFMVVGITVGEGSGARSGKAYGKLMGLGVREEAVVMTVEEGLELGCRMEVETVEEERVRMIEGMEMSRLEGELARVSAMFFPLSRDPGGVGLPRLVGFKVLVVTHG